MEWDRPARSRDDRVIPTSWTVINDHAHTTLFQASHTPFSSEMNDQDAASHHDRGTNSLLGDGSVRFLKNSISLDVYRALASRSGGEVISAESY